NETPAGLVDGANTSFVLSAVPNPATSLVVYRNGVLQKAGLDYSLAGNVLQFVSGATPQPGDTLLTSFRLTGGTVDPAQLYPSPQVLCSGLGSGATSTTLTSVGA